MLTRLWSRVCSSLLADPEPKQQQRPPHELFADCVRLIHQLHCEASSIVNEDAKGDGTFFELLDFRIFQTLIFNKRMELYSALRQLTMNCPEAVSELELDIIPVEVRVSMALKMNSYWSELLKKQCAASIVSSEKRFCQEHELNFVLNETAPRTSSDPDYKRIFDSLFSATYEGRSLH